jgi:hypothetical protein
MDLKMKGRKERRDLVRTEEDCGEGAAKKGKGVGSERRLPHPKQTIK